MKIALFVYNTDQRAKMIAALGKATMGDCEYKIINLRVLCSGMWVKDPKTKNTYRPKPEAEAKVKACIAKLSTLFDGAVCIDVALAHYMLPPGDRKGLQKIDKLSGMIMRRSELGEHMPIMFLMDPIWLYLRKFDAATRAQKRMQCLFQMRKFFCEISGQPLLEKPLKIVMPRTIAELEWLVARSAEANLIAADIETTGSQISCIGFALEHPDLPYTLAFTVAFYENSGTSVGPGRHLYWKDVETTARAWDLAAEICANDVPKIYHNGSYDMTFQFRYGMPCNNFIFDTQHMLHAMFPQMEKRLYQGAAMFLRSYRYWKDDAKDNADDTGQKTYMPATPEGHAKYWNYNALDCANTLELCISIMHLWQNPDHPNYPTRTQGYDYAWLNYVREFALQFGPCLYMSLTGFRQDHQRQEALKHQLETEAETALSDLQDFVWDSEFNPKSPKQTAELYYDTLHMPVNKRKGRTTDKRIVQSYADEHPIWNDVITMVNAAKEPANNASKYGELPSWNGLFIPNIKAGNTTTARLASAASNLRVSTNAQNFPYKMRTFCVAHEGEWLAAADYSQSDSYFVAFESQDETMMETVTDDRDTHSVHVEFFFGHDYASVVAGADAKEPWVVDPITGVRQIIKKVSHGTNYDMGGDTMLLNIRKDAAIAMVRSLVNAGRGITLSKALQVPVHLLQEPQRLSNKFLAKACDFAQSLYYKRYPVLARWKRGLVNDAVIDGGLIKMFGGSTAVMLEDPRDNPRFAPAAKGQGGTAGNINNAMIRLYYLAEDMWEQGFRMTLQVHDELVNAVPAGRIDLVEQMVRVMETPCEINGREFVIPVEADVSYTWCGFYAVGLDKCEGDPVLAAELIAEKEVKVMKELNL